MDKWWPYNVGSPPKVRPLQTAEGLGDRLRLIAFAERQAYHGFLEAVERFCEAPQGLLEAWKWVALEEQKHETWLVSRLEEMGQTLNSVPVSLNLYDSFARCNSAKEFALYIADAEERGRVGAERFAEVLKSRDPKTALIFAQIAAEEVKHIALVTRFF